MAVTIQDDMWEAAKTLNERQCDAFIAALVRYAFEGAEPPKESKVYPMFVLCKNRLDLSKKGNEQAKQDAEARRESARRAANARWAKDAGAMRAHDAGAMQPHDTPGNAYEVRGGEGRLGEDTPHPPMHPAFAPGVFSPPTPEDVDQFIEMQGYRGFTGEQFCAHYEAQGWVRGNGIPMTDWKSVVTSWALERKPGGERHDAKASKFEAATERYGRIKMVEEVAS